jgi:osmotically inducible lipoprotein OsmB
MNVDKAGPQTGHHPSEGRVMKSKFVAVVALPLVLTLSACGDTWGERAVTGGGIGAGTGLVIGAVAGWPLLVPVLVGTAVGAGIGAATNNNK